MPVAILTKARDYQNKSMFPKAKDGKILKGERVQVTEDEASHLFDTGLFEIIEDGAPPKRGNVKVTPKGVIKGAVETEKSVGI
jgi:hypothetical protein